MIERSRVGWVREREEEEEKSVLRDKKESSNVGKSRSGNNIIKWVRQPEFQELRSLVVQE